MKRSTAPDNGYDAINPNIEDTGRLMTGSSGGGRVRRLILLAVSAVLIIAVALAGFKLIQDKRYNDKIELAEKALAAGDYQTAETEYLAAMQINKHKVTAREGLAYTCAVEGKTDEAVELYEELYEDTEDPKYLEAKEETEKGNTPSDPDLVPAQDIWRYTEIENVPYFDYMNDFIYYMAHDENVWMWNNDKVGTFSFDSTDDMTPSIIHLFLEGLGAGVYDTPIEDKDEYGGGVRPWMEWIEGPDPRGWSGDNWYYFRIEANEFENKLKLVFNLSDEAIKNMADQAEKDQYMYKQDGYYYSMWTVTGFGLDGGAVEVNSVATNGVMYCICYDIGWSTYFNNSNGTYAEGTDYSAARNSVDRNRDHVTMYALMQVKVVDGKHYVSIYYNGPEMPAEVRQAMVSDN